MRTRLFALALCAVFPLCAACSGSTNRTPSIRTTMEIYAHLDMTQNRYVPRSVDDLKEF